MPERREGRTLYRQLAAARPDAFTPNLAKSLMTCGVHLAELGRYREALQADREAVALYDRLNAAHPEAFRNDRMNALRNLGVLLRNLKLDDEAEQVEGKLTTWTNEVQ
ncbi:MAG: hypothetical protein ACM3ML_07160 [Micromonosporaceae bacterium]